MTPHPARMPTGAQGHHAKSSGSSPSSSSTPSMTQTPCPSPTPPPQPTQSRAQTENQIRRSSCVAPNIENNPDFLTVWRGLVSFRCAIPDATQTPLAIRAHRFVMVWTFPQPAHPKPTASSAAPRHDDSRATAHPTGPQRTWPRHHRERCIGPWRVGPGRRTAAWGGGQITCHDGASLCDMARTGPGR